MSNYARFFSLYARALTAGVVVHDTHRDLLADITGGRTDSLRSLTPRELRDIEQKLQELLDPVEASMQRMRRKIIGILAARGAVNAKGKPDMPHVYAWVRKYGYLKKELNDYTLKELPKLVHQAEGIIASDIKAIRDHK